MIAKIFEWLILIVYYILLFLIVIRYFNKIFSQLAVSKPVFHLAAVGLFVASIVAAFFHYAGSGTITTDISEAVEIACLLSLLYRGKIRFKLLYSILANVFSAFSFVIVFYLLMLISKQSIDECVATHPVALLLISVLSIFIFYGILSLIPKLLSDVKSQVPIKYVVFLVTIPMISMVGILLTLWELQLMHKSIPYTTVVSRFAVLMCILYGNGIVFYLFDHVIKYMHKTADIQSLEKQIQLQDRFYKRLEKSQTEIRKMRHDMKHRLEAISIQLNANDYAAAETDLSDMLSGLDMQKIVDSGNPQLDAILNLKLSEARQAGIQVQAKVFVASGLRLTFSDLCVLLGNAFDNAIEACNQVEPQKKIISFEMSSVHQALFISLSNPLLTPVADDFPSTKKDVENHGFGLKSIQYIAEKYNGTVNIRTQQKKFDLEIVLQNPN